MTEATGLLRTELREIMNCSFPAVFISAFSLEEASDPAIGAEEGLLRGMLFRHALVGDVASARFAKPSPGVPCAMTTYGRSSVSATRPSSAACLSRTSPSWRPATHKI